MSEEKSVWETLSKIDVGEHTEKKGQFTYLSWAWAWATLKDNYPETSFEKHEYYYENFTLPYMIDPQGFAYVKVTVRVHPHGQGLSETMPVLNHQNKPIKNPDSFAVNTSLQRCLAKCIAMHGLGAYIYAGEDLPPVERIDCIEMIDSLRAMMDEKDSATVKSLKSQIIHPEDKRTIWQALNQDERDYFQNV